MAFSIGISSKFSKSSSITLLLLLVLSTSISCENLAKESVKKTNSQILPDQSLSNTANLRAAEQKDQVQLQETEVDEQEGDLTPIPVEQELEHQCETDSECGYMHVCNKHFQCHRKPLFPMTLTELLGSIVILVVVGIGQAAGVGGGLIVVPVLMSFFGYETKKSIALVFVTIFSASLGNLTSFMKQRAKDGGPLIDYKIVVLSLPTIMIGSIYGVALNKFLPQAVISVMLIFFILQSLTKTYKSYKREKAKELKENVSNTDNSSPLQDMRTPLVNENGNGLLIQSNKNDKPLYPRALLTKIGCITLGFVAFSLLRGGSKFESLLGIPPCGFIYQLCNIGAVYLSYILVKAIIAALIVSNTIEEKLVTNINSDEITLSADDMQSFAKSAFLAGLIGSIVGLGGGMILVPKWLEQGIPAQKTTSCSITLLFLTALNSVVQFGLGGVFESEEMIYFSIIALLSSFIVSSSIQEYVKRTNQSSILILIIILFMVVAFFLFGTMTVEKATTDLQSLFTFGEFC